MAKTKLGQIKNVKAQSVAVGVVILPPTEITNLAISLSEQLKTTSPITLNAYDYLPHITLAMGYSNTNATREMVDKVFKHIGPFTIRIKNIFMSPQAFEERYFWHLIFHENKALQKLHEELVTKLPFTDIAQPSNELFFTEPNEQIVPTVFSYVQTFKTQHSYANYWPHITLGSGPQDALRKPYNMPSGFTVDEINICQLGNFCTCRKKIDAVHL